MYLAGQDCHDLQSASKPGHPIRHTYGRPTGSGSKAPHRDLPGPPQDDAAYPRQTPLFHAPIEAVLVLQPCDKSETARPLPITKAIMQMQTHPVTKAPCAPMPVGQKNVCPRIYDSRKTCSLLWTGQHPHQEPGAPAEPLYSRGYRCPDGWACHMCNERSSCEGFF